MKIMLTGGHQPLPPVSPPCSERPLTCARSISLAGVDREKPPRDRHVSVSMFSFGFIFFVSLPISVFIHGCVHSSIFVYFWSYSRDRFCVAPRVPGRMHLKAKGR